jgi:hypothetical protein
MQAARLARAPSGKATDALFCSSLLCSALRCSTLLYLGLCRLRLGSRSLSKVAVEK